MKDYNHRYYRLFANCFLVKGFKRSIICDTQRSCIDFIPNDLLEILLIHSQVSIGKIKEVYGEENIETIEDYFNFLIKKEYIFLCDFEEIKLFPDINLTWDHPSIITNIIIDIEESHSYNFREVFQQLEIINCKDIQLRFFKEISIESLESIIRQLNESKIKSIEVFIPYTLKNNEKKIIELANNYFRIYSIAIHSAPVTKIINDFSIAPATIKYIKDIITSNTHCGFISPKYFRSNIQTFTESQKHNTCLNRKISIDVEGNIKNCPSMTKSYGNIRDTTLKEAVDKQGFKDVWYIHKDQIEVCKDCEFRHICTDCRAYIQDPNNIYSKPAKCSYDPYTATWGAENPTSNPLHGQ